MYEIKGINVPAEGLAVYHNGERVLEVLSIGSTINALVIGGRSLIDGYETTDSQSMAWYKSAVLFPFPNRLRDGEYTFEGESYQFPINEPANNNALHGFVYRELFNLKVGEQSEECAVIFATYAYEGQFAYYPFPFTLEAAFRIDEKGLTLTYTIRNTGKGSLPMGFGWHPYFDFSDGLDHTILTFESCQQVILDERQLPTGEFISFADFEKDQSMNGVMLDTGYRMPNPNWTVTVEDANGKLTLKSENMLYLQLYTPPGRKSIAIEPMSSGIDVFNSREGLTVLKPGKSAEYRSQVTYEVF